MLNISLSVMCLCLNIKPILELVFCRVSFQDIKLFPSLMLRSGVDLNLGNDLSGCC